MPRRVQIPIICILFALFTGTPKTEGQIRPEMPVISSVSVDPYTNDRVIIKWDPSPSPGVTGYKIYEWGFFAANPEQEGSEIPESPVTGTTTTHYTTKMNSYSMAFVVRALTSDTESFLSVADSTIHLSVNYDDCSDSAWLNWNPYTGWESEILRYQVVIVENGQTDRVIPVPANTTSRGITGLNTNSEYRFFITAVKNSTNPNDTLNSNGVLVSPSHRIYPEYIYANYGTVNPSNGIDIRFSIDPASELTYYSLWRSQNENSFDTRIAELETGESFIQYTDNDVNATERPYFYQLRVLNEECELRTVSVSSNQAQSVHLEARTDGTRVELQWNGYTQWPAGVEGYDLYRDVGQGFELMQTLGGASVYFTDNPGNGTPLEISSEICYQIVARENRGNPYGFEPVTSSSNIACVRLDPQIRFEFNAVAPETSNNRFRPEIQFIPDQYKFTIYNRWGNVVFDTDDPEIAWDLEHGLDKSPEGVYRYQVTYLNDQGKKVVLHGEVTVVR